EQHDLPVREALPVFEELFPQEIELRIFATQGLVAGEVPGDSCELAQQRRYERLARNFLSESLVNQLFELGVLRAAAPSPRVRRAGCSRRARRPPWNCTSGAGESSA